jgi:sugar lactone lactonase YvrE
MKTTDGRVVHEGLVFPEGPRWHDGRLWLSDMHAHRVLAVDPSGATPARVVVEDLGDTSSGLGFMPDGTVLVVSMVDRRVMRLEADTGQFAVHADLSELCDEFVNDLVYDSDGRCYVGCRNTGGGGQGRKDVIIRIDPDGSASIAATGLQGPNGMVIDDDQTMLIVAETPVGRLTRFDVTADHGLTNPTVIADMPGTTFDGICLDAEGMVWAGAGHTGGFLRVAPTGEVVDRVETAGEWAVACALGGADRRDLFMLLTSTSLDYLKRGGIQPELAARREGTRLPRNATPSADCSATVVSVRVDVPGAGYP